VTGSQVRVPLEWGGNQQGDRFIMPSQVHHAVWAHPRVDSARLARDGPRPCPSEAQGRQGDRFVAAGPTVFRQGDRFVGAGAPGVGRDIERGTGSVRHQSSHRADEDKGASIRAERRAMIMPSGSIREARDSALWMATSPSKPGGMRGRTSAHGNAEPHVSSPGNPNVVRLQERSTRRQD
jgi:hypothetical protein